MAAGTLAVIGVAGLNLIKESEGLRLKPYRDVAGIWTVCYGHTGKDIIPTKTYTTKECDDLLIADIKKHSPYITPGHPKNCIKNAPLTPNQRDALISFTFNVGPTNLCTSTMAKKLAARDYYGASQQFPRWNRSKGVVYAGLTTRRAKEQALFLSNQRSEASNTLSGRATAILMSLS